MQAWVCGVITAVAVGICVAMPARAQDDADARELASYRLTTDALRKLDAATAAMVEEVKKDPKIQALRKLEAEAEALEKKEERTEAEETRLEQLRTKLDELEEADTDFLDAGSLSEMEAEIRKIPAAANALRSAGMAPREYVKVILSMLEAGLVAGLRENEAIAKLAKDEIAELAKKVPAENVRFVREHEAELKALMQKWETLRGVQ